MAKNDISNTGSSTAKPTSSDFSNIKDDWATISKVSLYDSSHSSDYSKYSSQCVDGTFTRKYTQYVLANCDKLITKVNLPCNINVCRFMVTSSIQQL